MLVASVRLLILTDAAIPGNREVADLMLHRINAGQFLVGLPSLAFAPENWSRDALPVLSAS